MLCISERDEITLLEPSFNIRLWLYAKNYPLAARTRVVGVRCRAARARSRASRGRFASRVNAVQVVFA